MIPRFLSPHGAMAMVLLGTVLLTVPVLAADHAVILQYHHVADDTPASTSTRVDLFIQQLDYLAEKGFKVAPLGPTLAALEAGEGIADSTVCLTFDDAFPSVGTTAWPLVRDRGWPMTLFVSTGMVDDRLPSVMSWDEIKQAVAEGMTVGLHGVDHDYLARPVAGEDALQRRARLEKVVRVSGERLVAEVGSTAVLPIFVYPFGEFDEVLAEVVRAAGLVGLAQQSGPAWTQGDWASVPRYPMGGPYGSMESFGLKVASLPLPVVVARPESMILSSRTPSLELSIELGTGQWKSTQVSVYFSGDRLDPRWDGSTLAVDVPTPLPLGRSRINITAPVGTTGRWYWYSHPWLVLEDDTP